MRDISFAQYVLRCQAKPALAQKSAFELYQSYQRAQTRARWCSKCFFWLFKRE